MYFLQNIKRSIIDLICCRLAYFILCRGASPESHWSKKSINIKYIKLNIKRCAKHSTVIGRKLKETN